MTMHFADIARQAAESGAIAPEDILALRQAGWSNGAISPDEADVIFAIDDALGEAAAPEWSDFFVEALGEFVVNGDEPRGYVADAKAQWLMARIDRDGALGTLTELELLVRVLERALNAPAAFKTYVLEKIEQAVLTGHGPTRRGGALAPGHVTDAEAALLRRVLFAPAGDAPAAVSQGEAELLFRLKDASLGVANSPEWKRLFVQGVGNYLMGTPSPTAQIGRERAAGLESFVADNEPNVGGFLGRMVKSGFGGFGKKAPRKQPERDRFAELRAGEEVTGDEQAWLDRHIGAGGEVDEYEQALLKFLAEG